MRIIYAIILSCFGFQLAAQHIVSGRVTDTQGESLIGASIQLNDGTGTVTDINGNYRLELGPGTYQLSVSYIGYASTERELNISNNSGSTQLNFELSVGSNLDVVVVSGSSRPEKITESPATIETVFAREIEEYAGNPAELLARQKGVDYFRAGIATPAFNIRGFNSNFNSKNLQVTDGRFSTLIATGLPFGPLSTTIQEDIERYEVVLGPNATLYGPNAHNGLLNTITKDPRTSAGTTIAINPGVNGNGDAFFSGRLRHAQVLSDKFSFKVMGEYTTATEFDWADSVFIDRVGAFDEMGNAIPDGIQEGYEELELDPEVNFLRAEAALYYSPSSDWDIIFNTGYSNSNYLSPTNVGRNQIQDWSINYYQLRLSGKHWFAQAYYTQSQTDSTYAIDQRTKNYYAFLDAGFSDAEARGPLSYGNGALFQDDSDRWNAEIQYNNTFGRLSLIAGAQYQNDRANSRGTYLLDGGGDSPIVIDQLGAYAHLTYNIDRNWRVLAAARADNHEIYGYNFVPKLGIMYVDDRSSWRLTYGQGIAAPTILNLYGDLFAGLILGNAEGFTLADGTTIPGQQVEKLQTFELGYRGQVVENKLFLDANAYYNISQDFLSPLTIIGVATERGRTPIEDVQSGIGIWNGLVGTYINFGEVNTYGIDLGLTYYFTPQLSAFFNYSHFNFSVDELDPENDFNGDGEVNFLDLLVNAPTNKMGAGINYSGDKWFGSLFGRWVQEYNYFSSFQIASETLVRVDGTPFTYRGVPIVEDARSADTYNYGPLGGFVTFDLSLGYRLSDRVTLAAAASNLFNTELREFTASAPTRGLYTLEMKINLPAIGSRR
ncbi:MAG: TonB-dependent receptor [Bacteroidota bacterium]